MQPPTSGRQFTIASGDYVAEVASVGASLRALRFGGRDVVLPYEPDDLRPRFRGAVLAPWPNRIARGAWTWAGDVLQLPITEPERGHALHGLVAWLDWEEVTRSERHVALTTTVVPQPGYPFRLALTVTWTVDDRGLECRLVAENTGSEVAPYGCSIHPYLIAPSGDLDSWSMHLATASELLVDDTLIPTELVPILPEHDFRAPRAIGRTQIDHAFTGVTFDGPEPQTATVVDADGDGARVVFGPSTPWVQVCTSDWPGLPGHRRGVAVEPMTCPPNAFVSHADVIAIQPGADHTTWWRLEAVGGHP